MRNALVCWAPECGVLVAQPATGRPRLYCTPAHKMRARRRNGNKPPTEPFPPLEPTPLQQDATAATVVSGSEQQPAKPTKTRAAVAVTLAGGGSDAAGKARKARRDSVQPPAVATAGKAPAPVQPPSEASPVAPVRTPERTGAHPDPGASDPTGAASDGTAAAPAEAPAATVTQLHVAITENSTVPVEIKVHPMVAAYKADVAKLGKANDRQGLQVIEMAEKLVSSATSPAAAANLSKELERLMTALQETSNDALVNRDPSLIIRDRTLAKLRAIQDAAEASA